MNNLSYKEIKSLEGLIGINNITVKGTLGLGGNSDFINFPSKNIKSGDLYIVDESGLYTTEGYKTYYVNLLKGDIIVCKEDTEFALPTDDNWVRITRLVQNNFCIRCFVSYPIKKIIDEGPDNSSFDEKFKKYKKQIEDDLLRSYLLVNNNCTVSFINDEFILSNELLRYKKNPIDFTICRLKKLKESDYICFYKDWEEDPICNHEYEIAKSLNKNIIKYIER